MVRILILLFIVLLGGCAAVKLDLPPPPMHGTLVVSVPGGIEKEGWGHSAHRVESSHVYVSGQFKGKVPSILLGPVGFFIGMQMTEADSKKRANKMEGTLQVDVPVLVSDVVDNAIQDLANPKITFDGGANSSDNFRLELRPSVALTYVTDTLSRPYVVIEAVLRNNAGKVFWQSRYSAVTDEGRVDDATSTWHSFEGHSLTEAITRAANVAVKTALQDVTGGLNRSEFRPVKVVTKYAFIDFDFERKGVAKVTEDGALIFIPRKSNALICGGVNILPTQFASVSELTEL